MEIETIARITHEVNRVYCNSIGDTSQVPWEEAPQWQRDSATTGVTYLRDHPFATAEMSHQCWLDEKAATGWVYGPTKDAEQKTHPCIVPYDQLPDHQKTKDALFHAVCRAAFVD